MASSQSSRRTAASTFTRAQSASNDAARARRNGTLRRLRLLGAPLAVGFLSCHAPAARGRAVTETTSATLSALAPLAAPAAECDAAVLIVLDGVRWQEIFEGPDPELARAAHVAQGADLVPNIRATFARDGFLIGNPRRGERVVASGPNYVSMPGYVEIFGGREPIDCDDNACATTTVPTIADAVGALPATSPEDVAIVSSWESVPRAASARPNRVVMSAGRSATDARFVVDPEVRAKVDRARASGPWPGAGEYRPDEHTAEIALAYLERRRPRFLFVGLGDTDEHAHHGDYAGYVGALRAGDRFVGRVASALERIARETKRRTALVVTTDHGRAANFRDHGGAAPESADVWIGARAPGLGSRGKPIAARLADVAPMLARLLGTQPVGEAR